MTAERMKTRYVNRQHAPQIGYHSNVPWLSCRNLNTMSQSPLIALRLLKVCWRSVYGLWWKQCKRAYFCMCASTHFLKTSHNIYSIYWTKVHEIFTRCRTYIHGLCMGIGFAIFPIVVKCQHKKWWRFVPTCRRFTPQNWLLLPTSPDRSSPNF